MTQLDSHLVITRVDIVGNTDQLAATQTGWYCEVCTETSAAVAASLRDLGVVENTYWSNGNAYRVTMPACGQSVCITGDDLEVL